MERVVGTVVVDAPAHVGGPAIARAASGLMLLPANASRLVRLHRLAALGMAIADDSQKALSSSQVRALLKRDDIGGERIRGQEDPYSEILVQSMSFYGGEYLVSPGSGDHTVADVENLAEAAFRDDWMPTGLRVPMRQLIRGLLTVSNLVLKRAGLVRGTRPARDPGTPIDVPNAARLDQLGRAAFLSHEDLNAQAPWIRMVVDTFALDPGDLTSPCDDDIVDDRLLETPFLRLRDGYQLVAPLDLLLTIRHHLLRFAHQQEQLPELAQHYRETAVRRLERALRLANRHVLSEDELMNRYLFPIDDDIDLHVIAATDPLTDWAPDEMWGSYDNISVLNRIGHLIDPGQRSTYSSAGTVLHLVVTDSPGRAAFWGVPNVAGADPVLMARSDDLEVMLNREPDGALGLLYFAEALDRRPGESISSSILDEYAEYEENEKSFYFSDDGWPNFVAFAPGDGFFERQRYFEETDRHGVEAPVPGHPMLPVRRRYNRDAPEIFIVDSIPFIGYVVETRTHVVFISSDLAQKPLADAVALLLETVAFWVRECLVSAGLTPQGVRTHLVVLPGPAAMWTRSTDEPTAEQPVVVTHHADTVELRFTDLFVAQLQEEANVAERSLVAALAGAWLTVDACNVAALLEEVAPQGPKRMLNVFSEGVAPDLRAAGLPEPLTGHKQVSAQTLDELGDWLRDPNGAALPFGPLTGSARSAVLNTAVGHLFALMEAEIARYDQRALLEYLISHNEALIYFATYNTRMLRSRLACFGVDAETTRELVAQRGASVSAQRASRFLIEYVAARPPRGQRLPTRRMYYRLLDIAQEIVERGTASDFLHYGLADFDVSILKSGRLGMSRDDPVERAMAAYADAAGARSVRMASEPRPDDELSAPDSDIAEESADVMRDEYGFTLIELREVCGGLLDLGAAGHVTRIPRADALTEIAASRGLDRRVADTVLNAISLTARGSFMSIGSDAVPWRFNRDASYVRRPLVLQDGELVFGFRGIFNAGPFWFSSLVSGRLQGKARTQTMKAYISKVRGRINQGFAEDVAARLRTLGLTAEVSVNKICGVRIAEPGGLDLGDIDVLAWHPETRTVLAVEAKDFEVARTPSEISHEIAKLLAGKQGKRPERSTVQKHARRIEWLIANLGAALTHIGADAKPRDSAVVGVIVTSDPLVTPLVASSPIPIVSFNDLDLDILRFRAPLTRGKSRSGRKSG